MNEPTLKKKNILKAQYIYNIILLLILFFGISYAVVTFLHNEEGANGNIVSSLVKITVAEDTSFNLDNTSPVTDEVGLQGYSKTLTLTNTSTIDSLVTVTLNPDASNNIPPSNIKYGLYINGTLKKTSNFEDLSIYNGLVLQGEQIKLEIYIWVDSSYTGSGTIFKGNFDVKSTEAVLTLADYITKLVDKDKGVYKVGNDYRYSGTNPNNYIWFNCKDGTTGGSGNCELWRIVGSLETKANEYANTYRRVKIVKEEAITGKTFGSNNTFSGSLVDTYLNGDYYTSLTTQSQKMIINSTWNVGSSSLTSTPAASLTSEQATKLYTKVGLLSASDFGYSTSTTNQTKAINNADLYTNSWLKGSSYYTLTPISGNTTTVIGNNSTSITNLTVTTTSGVKPTVSLIPNVYIKSGNGTSNSPYEIAIVNEEEHYSNVPVVGYITYDVNEQSVTAPKMQAIYADGSAVINGTLSDTSEAKFKGWATSKDGEVVYQKGDAITAKSDITLYAVWQLPEKLVDKITSTLSLTAPDTDGTRFVYGADVDNNYVWHSGKLWRIVAINSDNSIKLVTQGNMTTVEWDTSSRNTNYSTSQMRSWLNTEFLPTINADLIVESNWDYTTYSSFPISKITTTNYVTEKVGLLNIYEYMMTGGTSSSSTSKTFLNNGYFWGTMSPNYDDEFVWYISCDNNAYSNGPTISNGVRPSINLKSNITLTGEGNGQLETPYTLEGDTKVGQVNELLSSRLSGEYIKFNNTKYRIVGIENGLTKITMADYDLNMNTLSTSVPFGASIDEITFSTTYGIGKYLNDWYNATSENDTNGTYAGLHLSKTAKAMIATDGIKWYTGPTSGTGYDYTLSKTGTLVSATIGLGYYGEMFSSQFGDGYDSSTHTWLMTKYMGSYVMVVSNLGHSHNKSPIDSYGVRPSFYLKSDVKITGGSGMPHDPYEISQ